MAGCGNFLLLNDDRMTDGAVLAFRQAGLRAGRLNRRVDHFRVALRRDHFLSGNHRIADRALLSICQTSFRTGCCLTGNLLCLVAGCGNHFLRNENLVANRAVLAFRQTSLCAGWSLCCIDHFRMASRGDHFALLDLRTADGAHGIAGVAVLGTGSCFGITNFSNLMCARLAAPCAIGISNRIARRGILGFSISAVGIVQLGSGDGNLMCRHAALLRVLIRLGLRSGGTLLVVDASTGAGADVCAACGGVDTADSGQRTVDVHLYIRQRSTLTCPSGGNNYRHVLRIIGAAVAAPLGHIVNVHTLPACHRQLRVPGDRYLHARQQRRRLVHGQFAARGQINSHIVGKWQNIAAGADAHACQLQIQAVDLRYTVYCIDNTVGGTVIRLGQAAGNQLEHTLVTDKGNGGGVDLPYGVYRSIHRLAGAGVQGQGYLHILHGVLAKGEHLVAHFRRCRAAAEVQNLVPFVDRAAGLHGDGAAAGDKAPSVQITTVLDRDGAVVSHFDIAVITHRTSLLAAGSSIISAAQADRAIDRNGASFAHRQRSERLRSWGCANRRRRIRIQCSRLIKRNQKCNSSRNSIGTADGAISRQGNLGLTVCLCIGNRLVQVVKHLTAGLKERRINACEPRCDGAVAFNVQRSLCRRADIFLVRNIIPAHELITIRRGRHYLISSHGTLRVAVFLGNEFSVYCISTVFSRHESRSCIDIAYQNHVGKGDLRSSTGAARLDVYFNALVCRQFLGKTGTRRNLCTIHLNRSTILFNGIVKRKGCCCRLLICNCQCGFIVFTLASARAGSCTDNARTIGRPRIICVAFKTQSNVLVG